MSSLILLSHLRVENANTVAGLTWGFPAITHFLGYMHALSRRLTDSHGVQLDGCAVICHEHQTHAYSSGCDYQFTLTRNPLTREEKTAPFNEEGRIHFTVSLIFECHGEIANGRQGSTALADYLHTLCQIHKLAGGSIVALRDVKVMDYPQEGKEIRRLLYWLLPGFVLLDRSPLLATHYQTLMEKDEKATLLDAWLDFAALKSAATQPEANPTPGPDDPVQWRYLEKPAPGFLIPMMTGYQRLSELFPAGQVANARDDKTPFAWVEAAYGIGEWRALHRIKTLSDFFWRYRTTETGYYCCGVKQSEDVQCHDDSVNYE
ncbi:type I-F CRISPR-associated protein Csy2 [Salmonella enterica]|uniref:type I-F CRISPR-associated protein Csy2 n=1 Tax=Salmonella enterica TaxID=28901 RepID=UPI00103488A0|nr:type I-F CRISPR-associated protein Csy2 [Salmonella enterica]EJJ1581943.1 type I-F CRISPR-associated protein Csy2 [Salmonella enterica]EJN0204860.1 type I-F CRISPR-associated protein Csy2 [Salmonella enterica]TBN97370.1 type I-F CRISPR-associated protein Csy2 [Salmonella enterica subsp. salamae serovar 13,22:z:-]